MTKLNNLLFDIESSTNDIKKIEIKRIYDDVNSKKKYTIYKDDYVMFDSLVFIPVYNTQLKMEKDVFLDNYKYYLKLNSIEPINRILIWNKQGQYIGTLFYFKERSFILYDIIAFSRMNYQCQNISDHAIKRLLPAIKKQIFKKPLPICIIINNFSKELFLINDDNCLMTIYNKRKLSTADIYFEKKIKEKKIMEISSDTVLKYIKHDCIKSY